MRIEAAASSALLLLLGPACGGNSVNTGATCGPGTTLVEGQCVVAGGGAAGNAGGTGGTGVMSAGGFGGDSMGGVGGSMSGGAGTNAPDAAAPPSLDFCLGREVVATGSPGLLDDFEDHDMNVLLNDGRHARWSLFGTGCTFTPESQVSQAPVAGVTSINQSHYAMHVTATECTQSPNLNAGFNGYGDGVNGGNCAYDASLYDGIYFWAVGAGMRVNVLVGLRTTISAMYGGDGSCARADGTGCYDRHAVAMSITGEWKLYSVTWNQLRQAGWGTKAAWDAKLTDEIVFEVTSNIAAKPTVDFSIDNVGFFKGMPPTDLPMAGQ